MRAMLGAMGTLPIFYDCKRCPAYCCTYARIAVEPSDLVRLARRFAIPVEEATRRFTVRGATPDERVLRHRKDEIFGTACRFLDARTRRCTVYEHRPDVCREYPDSSRCGYYDFLAFERRAQDDPELTVSARVELSDGAAARLDEGGEVVERPATVKPPAKPPRRKKRVGLAVALPPAASRPRRRR